MLKRRLLGKTALEVSELSLGGLFVSKHGGARDQSVAAIRRALDLGVNYIDTAPMYADSEEVIGEALEGETRPCLLSTKLGYKPEPFVPQNRDFLLRAFEASLKRLRRDSVDILMIHEPDRHEFNWWTDKEDYLGPVYDVLLELKEQGRTRFIGLGGTTAYEMPHLLATGRYDVVLTAFNYSLLWREAEWAVLPEAKRQGMGTIIGSALQQGGLSRRYDDQVRAGPRWLSPPRREQYLKLYELLDELSLPIAEVAYRWALTNPNVHTVLMGARSVEEVEQNVAAAEKGPLPNGVMARLKEIHDMVPFRPFLEPFGLPF